MRTADATAAPLPFFRPTPQARTRVTDGKQLVFVADDFGLNATVNEAIVHTHCNGALTGTSLMLGQPGTDDAVALARANPTLEIGWHLHLCDSRPLTVREWPWGSSPARAGLLLALTPTHRQLVRTEVERQWQAFQDTGLPCRFINTHHHLHLHPWVSRVLLETVGKVEGAWFRGGAFRSFGPGEDLTAALTRHIGNRRAASLAALTSLPTPATVWGLDRVYRMSAPEISAVAPSLPPALHEFMFHPRAIADDADVGALLRLRDSTR